jgi:hypothetical protein
MKRWGLAILVSLLLTACSTLEMGNGCTPTSDAATVFRPDQFHLETRLPPGWVAVEGPELVAKPFEGLVAFNSWGEAGFWAPEVTTTTGTGMSATYSPASVLGQIPHGEAYVVLIRVWGPGPLPEEYGPEYEPQDLSGLWQHQDCREGQTAEGATFVNFFKWGRVLRLEVYCDQNASSETVEAVNALLGSWRFDHVPAGDIEWAALEARDLLPPEVEPSRFSMRPSLRGDGNVVRITQAEVQAETVVVTFMYGWDVPQFGSSSEDCPPHRCHWWKIAAMSSGEVMLKEEGGATLPGRTAE